VDEGTSWSRAHWRTAVALVLIFGIALFLRVYFVYDLAFTNLGLTCEGDPNLPVSGGSDSFYWHRALCYSYDTGRDLDTDSMLNYGQGLDNPRPPLFPWFSLLVGRLLAPLFADPWHAVLFVFLLSTGLFGALTVIPTYLLTKEAFGRRAGLVAAFLLAVSSAHMQRSQATDADHDAWTLFFVVTTFYFFLRSLKVMQPRRWVENWYKRDSIRAGVRAFVRENRKSVLYATLSGLCIAVIALSWQGWAYVPVILLVYFVVQLFLDRVRNTDPMGITALFSIAMVVPLLVALPWYLARNQVRVWFDVPAYLFLAAAVLGVTFTVTRDYPWTLVIPFTMLASAAALAVLVLVNPALANAFVSGAGYFVQTKVYETIAEAQAPGLSQLILSFGFFTFYFSVAAVALMLWQVPRRRDAAYALIVIWAFAAIFMAMAAARFIFNASPAFAVTAAFAVDLILTRADFAGMRRTYRSLVQGSWRNAVRKSLKIRHVLVVLLLVGAVVLPNVWWGVDASIPFERKSAYDRQVQDVLPPFLRAPGYTELGGRGSFYFGAFGYSIPQPTEYFPAAWRWFRTQDADTPPELRPAFLSWWDYGFEAVDRGQHPTVADNFQNGFAFAGQFITAQNESAAVALLSVRLLESDVRRHGGRFGAPVEGVLSGFGLPSAVYRSAIVRPGDLISLIRSDPVRYGAWDDQIQVQNALYIYMSRDIVTRVGPDRVADLYHAVRGATGQDIGYFAVDSRLFPLSAVNTGIFYAPVKLSDHRVLELPDGRTLPTEFYDILVTTDRAQNIRLQDVQQGEQIRSQQIRYNDAFYRSMFYRAYIGYSPADLGNTAEDAGIPGLSQQLINNPPVPAWNLSHFRVVYRTAYYNPFADPSNHTDAWRAMDVSEAQAIQEEIQAGRATGVVDPSTQAAVTNGIVFLRYYDGAWVNGTVLAGGETPVAGVRITVSDELGTPHYVTTSDASGRFSALVPFGDITITASVGTPSPRTLVGSRPLASLAIPVTLGQAMREATDADGDGRLDWLMTRDLGIPGRAVSGTAFFDLDGDGALDATDQALGGASLSFEHTEMDFERSVRTDSEGRYVLPAVPTGRYRISADLSGRVVPVPELDLATGGVAERDVPVPFADLGGLTVDRTGQFVAASVEILDETTGETTTVEATSAGFYSLRPVLEGNYTIAASAGELAAVPARVRVTPGDVTQNLTLIPSGVVSGETRLFGLDQPYATLEFQRLANVSYVRSVRSDATGAFSVVLPAGEWNVNGRLALGTALYAHLGRVSVVTGATTTYDAMFVDGAKVVGSVTGATSLIERAQIAFSTPTSQWWLRESPRGAYVAYLPTGSYAVEAFTTSAAYYGSASVTSSRTLDLPLENATSATARVFRDLNGDGTWQSGEEIGGASVRLADDRGRAVLAVSGETGVFRLVAAAERTFTGRIEAFGFDPLAVNGTVASIRAAGRYALAATPVAVRGALLLDGSPLRFRTLTVRAEPLGPGGVAQTALTDTNGGFELSLVPGSYELVVDENVSSTRDRRYQNLEADVVDVRLGSGSLLRDVDLAVRSLVTGDVTRNGTGIRAAVTFRGPDERNAPTDDAGAYEAYLRDGTYDLGASAVSAPASLIALADAAVSGPTQIDVALVDAISLSGVVVFNRVGLLASLPIQLERREGGSVSRTNEPGGRYSASLVPGTYDVRVDAVASEVVGTDTRYYRYTFTGSLTVPSGSGSLTFNLDLSRAFDNTTVSGVVRYAGTGVDATISFLARGGGALDAATASAADGSYSVGVAPGTYEVYARRPVGSIAFLGSLVVPHADAHPLDVDLEAAHLLSGVVTDVVGVRTTANVTVEGGSRLDLATDAAGAYEALLPAGSYVVTATRTGSEQGVSVDYRATADVDLEADAVANLPLAKVVRRAVSLSWDVAERQTIGQGESVVYTIEIANTGNVADTYTLSGQPSDWDFTFLPSTIPLEFGTSGATRSSVSVTIRAPDDALVVHGPLSLVATSSDGATTGTVSVDVFIERVRSLSVRVNATSGVFDGRLLNYTVEIRNAGNDQEAVTVLVANPEDLASSGWTARLVRTDGLGTPGVRITDIPVNANGTTRVRLELSSPGGPSDVPVVIQAFSQDDPGVASTVVHTARLPSLSAPDGAAASGPNVVGAAPLLPLPIFASLVAALSAVGAGLFLTRRRR
jgi:dolichyl-diphosphooligosaccharide--protein glycosyltransferase